MGFGFSPKIGFVAHQSPTFSPQQRAELLKVASSQPGFSCQGTLGKFFDLWLVSEVLAKKLIMYHKNLNELPNSYTYEQISSATRHYNFNFDIDKIPIIFKGGDGKRGSNTPRQLRNGYLHSLSIQDEQEINSRYVELAELLEGWRDSFNKI